MFTRLVLLPEFCGIGHVAAGTQRVQGAGVHHVDRRRGGNYFPESGPSPTRCTKSDHGVRRRRWFSSYIGRLGLLPVIIEEGVV